MRQFKYNAEELEEMGDEKFIRERMEHPERFPQIGAAAKQSNAILTTEQLKRREIAYFVFTEKGLEHLSGWRVGKFCKQTRAYEFWGTDGTYIDSRRYFDGTRGVEAYSKKPKKKGATK